jgi:hypothetical protein
LVTFLAAGASWYLADSILLVAALASGLWITLFSLAVQRHHRAYDRRMFSDAVLDKADESLQRCGGRITVIHTAGRPNGVSATQIHLPSVLQAGRTWHLTPQEQDDLDIYAEPVGIFGLLNRASTLIGQRRLSEWVDNPCLCAERIIARQTAVRWMADHPAERLRIMASTGVLKGVDETLAKLGTAIGQSEQLPFRVRSFLMRLWSLPAAVLMVLATAQALAGHYQWLAVLTGILILNGGAFVLIRGRLKARMQDWQDVTAAARGYLSVARQAISDLPNTTDLAILRDCFERVAAGGALPSLCRWLPWAEASGPIHTFLNIVLFYNLHVLEGLLAPAVRRKSELLEGLSTLAETEALASLACFAWEQPQTCYPQVVSEPRLSIRGGLHPLVEPNLAVANDIDLTPESRMWIITGLNMAGKSTFLRMVGINLLLAQIGTAALAEEMSFMPANLMTDLRTRDDIRKNESYLLAEVRQIRRMVLPSKDESHVLGLIDEPLRGTNWEEHVAASIALLEHLRASQNFFVVATHERQLTALAADPAVENYHFRDRPHGDGPVFDHRLRPGAARIRNAIELLRREGYPISLLDRAREWLRDSTAAES